MPCTSPTFTKPQPLTSITWRFSSLNLMQLSQHIQNLQVRNSFMPVSKVWLPLKHPNHNYSMAFCKEILQQISSQFKKQFSRWYQVTDVISHNANFIKYVWKLEVLYGTRLICTLLHKYCNLPTYPTHAHWRSTLWGSPLTRGAIPHLSRVTRLSFLNFNLCDNHRPINWNETDADADRLHHNIAMFPLKTTPS
jgi:hypothetical protein